MKNAAVDTWNQLPPGTGAEIGSSVLRLRKARTPRQMIGALEFEIVQLFDTITPRLVEHALPIHTPARARAVVGVVAGSAAALDELEAIALLIPGVDAATVPTIPFAAGATFLSLVAEAYVAGSLRVHMLGDNGREPDPTHVTRDVMFAMSGRDEASMSPVVAQLMSRRMLRRWVRGVVPVVGIGYASWDAQRTVREISRLPI